MDQTQTITLITVGGIGIQNAPVDRLGGEAHGVVKNLVGEAVRQVPLEQFSSKLEDILRKVQAVAGQLRAQTADFSVDEIVIGLSISGEGSIGIATAGVEASIEIKLMRQK